MILAIIAAAVVVAAVYLLRPLFTATAVLILLLSSMARAAVPPPGEASIGLLLIAVDAQRDHLRVSEALRISNPGRAVALELAIALPPSAQYVTYHRGLGRPLRTADGFRDRLVLRPGLTEVVYSYALPSGSRAALVRAFPLPVQRAEVVVRGGGVTVGAGRGQALPPLMVAGERLARWEARQLRAGEEMTVILDRLPVSRPWIPAAGAGMLAAVLAAGFLIRLVRGAARRGGVVSELQNS